MNINVQDADGCGCDAGEAEAAASWVIGAGDIAPEREMNSRSLPAQGSRSTKPAFSRWKVLRLRWELKCSGCGELLRGCQCVVVVYGRGSRCEVKQFTKRSRIPLALGSQRVDHMTTALPY
jgi:hypothetical protein